jgi:hypothetical protein
LEIAYNLKVDKRELVIQNRRLGIVKLQPISKDFFQSKKDFYVKFNRNKEGKIEGFTINSERTLDVFFKRIE